jgi:hypothetical protein
MPTDPTFAAATKATAINQVVKDAQSLPALVAGLKTIEPDLAAQIEGKALASSKTPWVTLLGAAVAWISTKYGFGWDDTTDSFVTGAVLLIVSYIMRALSNVPITGFFVKAEDVFKAFLVLLLLSVGMGLSACGNQVASPSLPLPPAPATPDEAVAELETGYTAALQLATSYAQLPRCGPGVSVACSNPSVVAALASAQATASKDLDAVRGTLLAYDAGTADLAAIDSLINTATTDIAALSAAAKSAKGS